jgi:hypothetical protein
MEKVRELSITNALTDCYLLLVEIKDLKRSLSLELDLARDRRMTHEAEFRKFMGELWDFLDKLAAKYCLDLQLLNLVREPNAGDKKRGKEGTQAQAGRLPSYRK